MTFVTEKSERFLAILLTLALGGCSPAEPPVADEPDASVQPAEPMADAQQEVSGAEESAPEPDRFANMFVSEVTHDFNPGLPIGAQFPAIRALFEGEEIMSIDRFIRDRGAIFIAARSVDW